MAPLRGGYVVERGRLIDGCRSFVCSPLQAQRTGDKLPAVRDVEDLADPRPGDEARQPVRVYDEVREIARRLQVSHSNRAARVAEDSRAVPTERVLLPGQRH